MMSSNGDTSLIPVTNPTVAERDSDVYEGKACWAIELHVGANSDDDGGGAQDADATFTFTATLP